jgi:hypothetical protein
VKRVKAEDLPIIELSGTPRERGRTHGETLRPEIREALEVREAEISRDTGVPNGEYIERFLGDTDFVAAIEKWTPGLLDEVRGISEGAAVDYERVLAHQLIDEEWLYRVSRDDAWAAGSGDRCSALGIAGEAGRPTLVAQNLDIERWREGSQVVLHVRDRDSDLDSLVVSFAGLVCLAGLNSRGIGVCINALMDLPHHRTGLPVAFAIRGALGRGTLEDATGFLRLVRHASGQNYVIGGPEGVHSLECSGDSVVEYAWKEGRSRVCHTNHRLVLKDGDDHESQRIGSVVAEKVRKLENTRARLRSLESRLEDSAAVSCVEDVASVLSAHDDPENPVCRHPDGPGSETLIGVTTFSMIHELSQRPVLHLAPGPPCHTGYRELTF